jgi:hypothetical protein
VAVGWEGVGCLVMASPILLGLASLGAGVGLATARGRPTVRQLSPLLLLVVPGLVAADVARPPQPPALSVVSSIRVAAPIETVWQNVLAFPPITSAPPPIFALVAMPKEARIDGRGPGAIRRCIFTNGTFVEPIEVWNAPHELTFGVKEQPRHLDEYGDFQRGQFLLTANPDGTTTLTGTTWYRLKVYPTFYFNAWAKVFLHAIHLRVLEHVKEQAERPTAIARQAAAQPDWMATANETCNCTRHLP